MTEASGVAPAAKNGKQPEEQRQDVTVDQKWPLFTVDGVSASRAAGPGDQTPNVATVLRDVLGARLTTDDPKAFVAALNASFALEEVEGHVESRFVERGFALQADLGAVSGGQASLYARAKASRAHMLELLDGLTPLRPDFDAEDGAAVRALIRTELTRIVDETGRSGGPRTALVTSSFRVLLGRSSDEDDVAGLAMLTGDTTGGQLGRLREVFGLLSANVNTVDEERVRTAYWTLVDEVLDLRRAWGIWAVNLRGDSAGFLGTDLVLLSRLLEAALEQVDEYEEVLDSVLLGPADRQTIWVDERNGLTLDGLLAWTRQFLRTDGPAYLNDSGRDGLQNAFLPAAESVLKAFRRRLVHELQNPRYPDGLRASRSRVALDALVAILGRIVEKAAAAAPTTKLRPLEVVIWPLDGSTPSTSTFNRRRPALAPVPPPRVPRNPSAEFDGAQEALDRALERLDQAEERVASVKVTTAAAEAAAGAHIAGLDLASARRRRDEAQRARRRLPDGSLAIPRADGDLRQAETDLSAVLALEATREVLARAEAGRQRARRDVKSARQAYAQASRAAKAGPGTRFMLVQVRLSGAQVALEPAFRTETGRVFPEPGTLTADEDSISAVFAVGADARVLRSFLDQIGDVAVLTPEELPLLLLEQATGLVVYGNDLKTWPTGVPTTWTKPAVPTHTDRPWRRDDDRTGF